MMAKPPLSFYLTTGGADVDETPVSRSPGNTIVNTMGELNPDSAATHLYGRFPGGGLAYYGAIGG